MTFLLTLMAAALGQEIPTEALDTAITSWLELLFMLPGAGVGAGFGWLYWGRNKETIHIDQRLAAIEGDLSRLGDLSARVGAVEGKIDTLISLSGSNC